MTDAERIAKLEEQVHRYTLALALVRLRADSIVKSIDKALPFDDDDEPKEKP